MSLNPYAKTVSDRKRRTGFVVFSILYWALFFLFAETTIVGDGIHYHTFFPALLSDRNLNLADEFVAYPQGSPFAIGFKLLPTGYAANPYPFGSSLLQLPFLIGAWVYDRTVGLASEIGIHDFLSAPYLVAQILSTWFYCWIGCFCLWRILEKLFRTDDSFLIVLSMVTATPLLNYLIHDPAYSHAYSFFAVSFFYFLWFCVSRKDSFASGLLIGAAGGLVFLVRWQDVLFLFPAAVYSIGMGLRGVETEGESTRLRQRFAFVAGGLIGFLAWISPQLIYWNILYGSPVLVPLGEKIYSEGYYFQESLFSKKNGLFKWHPLTLAATIGLIWMAYKKRWLWWILPAMILQFLFIGSLADWTGSYAFGQRRWVSGLPFWAMGLAALFSIRWKPWRWLLRAGILYLIVWNFLVFQVWHGGFFEGGRHSTSKVFWMLQNTPEFIFGDLFQLAFFPNLMEEGSPRRLSLFLLAFLLTLLTASAAIVFLNRPLGRRAVMALALPMTVIPLVLGGSFVLADRTSAVSLQADLMATLSTPGQSLPLIPVKKGKAEIYAGVKSSLILGPKRKTSLRIQNPQVVSELNLIGYLSSAAPEIEKGQECLRMVISGLEGKESKTVHVGEEFDFPSPEFGRIREASGALDPQTVELDEGGTVYFSYGVEFPFSSQVVRAVTLENLLPMGEIGIEAVSLIPMKFERDEISAVSPESLVGGPAELNLNPVYNDSIADLAPPLGFIPGATLEWRGIPFSISDSTGSACLNTGIEPLPLSFSTPVRPVECQAIQFLLTEEGASPGDEGPIATLRLHFSDGGSAGETVYTSDLKGDYWSVSTSEGGRPGLYVKTVLVPSMSGPLIGLEIERDHQIERALVILAATAVP